jgi:branched-chain amino acid transport system substrate-binding protein
MKKTIYAFTIWFLMLALLGGVSHAADTIRVGTTQPLTGKFKAFGEEQLRGLQMWVHDINARGALLGKDVELVYYDDYSEADRSALLYRQLIEKDKVDLLIGPYSSGTTLSASTIAEQHNFPMVASAASAEKIWRRGYKNIFGTDVPAANYMHIAIAVAQENGAKTFDLVSSDTEFSREVASGVREEIASRGLTLLMDEVYQLDQVDFSALAKKLRDSKGEVLLGATYLEDALSIRKAIMSLGATAKVRRKDMVALTVGPALRAFGDKMGPAAEGIVGVVQWLRSVHKPGAQDFAYRYRLKYGYNPGVHAAIGYSAGQVMEAAVRLAGSLDKDAVREQLKTMTFHSLFGEYKVDETGRQIGKRNYLLQWQDDRRRLVAPPDVAERKLIYPRN